MSEHDHDVSGIVEMWGFWTRAFARSCGYVVQPQGKSFAELCLAMADAACRLWRAVDPHERRAPVAQPERPAGLVSDASAPKASSGTSGAW
ncbi:MAG: hypothetical protein KGZ61_11315 [Sandarakinorhabdus sp.]|nr:hypothetical protein [Sandarakinorhabdus sp.]